MGEWVRLEEEGEFEVEETCGEVVGDAARDVVDVGDPEVGDDVAEVEEVEDFESELDVVEMAEEISVFEILELGEADGVAPVDAVVVGEAEAVAVVVAEG